MIYWRFHWALPLAFLLYSASQARALTDVIANGTRPTWVAVATLVVFAWTLWAALSMWCSTPVKIYRRPRTNA